MIITKDTDEQIVLQQSRGMRIFAKCLAGFGALFFLIGLMLIGVDIWAFIVITSVGLVCLLIGLYGAGNVKEITFDHSLGYITVRGGAKPFPLKARHISKAEVQRVDIRFLRGGLRGQVTVPDRWEASVALAGKKVKIHTDVKQRNAQYIANRIRTFVGL